MPNSSKEISIPSNKILADISLKGFLRVLVIRAAHCPMVLISATASPSLLFRIHNCIYLHQLVEVTYISSQLFILFDHLFSRIRSRDDLGRASGTVSGVDVQQLSWVRWINWYFFLSGGHSGIINLRQVVGNISCSEAMLQVVSMCDYVWHHIYT